MLETILVRAKCACLNMCHLVCPGCRLSAVHVHALRPACPLVAHVRVSVWQEFVSGNMHSSVRVE